MKKNRVFVLSAMLLICSFKMYSQRGQQNIGLSYLGVDKGYGVTATYQQSIGDNYFGYRVDADYFKRDYNITVVNNTYPTTLEKYAIGSAMNYSFEKIFTHPFYLQAFIGGQFGQEKLNGGGEEIDGIPYDAPKKIVFGAYAGIEFEMSITNRFNLAILAKNTFTNSEVKKSMFFYGFGLKYNLNY